MADPVVHFEIIGADPQRLREYYSALFGWSFATPSPVADAVSDTGEYGFLDLVQAEDGSGIRGGVGAERVSLIMRSFTSASPTLKPRSDAPKNSAALALWVLPRRPMVWSWRTSVTPRAP